MMSKMEILEAKIKEYGKNCLTEENEAEREMLRKQFVKKFPIDEMGQMTLEQYALGTECYKDSFCYWLETKLDSLGNIHSVSGSSKFGVYFGKRGEDKTNKWRWTKWTNEDFSVIRSELILLLEAGKKKDLAGIEKNRLSKMFKGKILACYYPKEYGNVFSYEHIKYFLQNAFDIFSYPDQFEAQELLLKQKSMHSKMKKWSNLKFSTFLYMAYPDVKVKNAEEINEDTPQIFGNKLVPIFYSGQAYEAILKSNKEEKKDKEERHPKADYEKIAKHNASVGKAGEKAVFDYEKKRLVESGRPDLSDKVEWVSLETDSLGYDIKSFNVDGSERHIEVKTNTGAGETVSFFISAYEYYMLQTDPFYEICYVFGKKKKKVYHIDCLQLRENFGMFATPISYKVDFVTKDTLC